MTKCNGRCSRDPNIAEDERFQKLTHDPRLPSRSSPQNPFEPRAHTPTPPLTIRHALQDQLQQWHPHYRPGSRKPRVSSPNGCSSYVRTPPRHAMQQRSNSPPCPNNLPSPLTNHSPGLPRLDPKLHPSLQHARVHVARLQPHLRRPAGQAARARNLAVVAHLRHLDVSDQRDPLLRRIPHQ